MRRRAALACALLCGCKFDPSTPGVPADAPPPSDARGDGLPDGALDGATDATQADAGPPDAPPCPTTYVGRYRFVATTSVWLSAEEDCEDDGFGTHLLVVDDPAEDTAFVDSLTSASKTWVGFSDRRNEDTWRWVTGETGTSLGTSNQDDCGYYYIHATDGTPGVQQSPCDAGFPYLCECDGRRADPSAY